MAEGDFSFLSDLSAEGVSILVPMLYRSVFRVDKARIWRTGQEIVLAIRSGQHVWPYTNKNEIPTSQKALSVYAALGGLGTEGEPLTYTINTILKWMDRKAGPPYVATVVHYGIMARNSGEL